MKVVDRELYLGAALAQIVESTGFECIRKVSPALGHYEVNGALRLLVRYTASRRGPWYFTFRPRDLDLVAKEVAADPPFYLALVCGTATICLLTAEQVVQVLDLDSAVEEAQSIRVHTRPGASLSVTGSAGTLDGKVPNHVFPGTLFRSARVANGE